MPLSSFPYAILDFKRQIRIYLPVGYEESETRYPVLYMHDGQNVFEDQDAIQGESLRLKEHLDEEKLPLIVVGIDNNTEENGRVDEYCPWQNGEFSRKILEKPDPAGGRGNDYVRAIVDELKPVIDGEFRTKPDETYMAGISLGGLITMYAACHYPHIFKRVAGISSAFYRNQEEIEKLIQESDLSAVEKMYMDCGTNELPGKEQICRIFQSSNESVYALLKEKPQEVHFQIEEGSEHSYPFFRKRMPAILSYLLEE